MRKLIFILILLFPLTGFSQFKIIDDNRDKYNSLQGSIYRYDKVEHFVASTVLSHTLQAINQEHGWKYALAVGFAWEVKDGFGSQGFSVKDLQADMLGVFTGYCSHQLYSYVVNKYGIGGHKGYHEARLKQKRDRLKSLEDR